MGEYYFGASFLDITREYFFRGTSLRVFSRPRSKIWEMT